jgi:hypothetical protein
MSSTTSFPKGAGVANKHESGSSEIEDPSFSNNCSSNGNTHLIRYSNELSNLLYILTRFFFECLDNHFDSSNKITGSSF